MAHMLGEAEKEFDQFLQHFSIVSRDKEGSREQGLVIQEMRLQT